MRLISGSAFWMMRSSCGRGAILLVPFSSKLPRFQPFTLSPLSIKDRYTFLAFCSDLGLYDSLYAPVRTAGGRPGDEAL